MRSEMVPGDGSGFAAAMTLEPSQRASGIIYASIVTIPRFASQIGLMTGKNVTVSGEAHYGMAFERG